jgi:hypothetical protein
VEENVKARGSNEIGFFDRSRSSREMAKRVGVVSHEQILGGDMTAIACRFSPDVSAQIAALSSIPAPAPADRPRAVMFQGHSDSIGLDDLVLSRNFISCR